MITAGATDAPAPAPQPTAAPVTGDAHCPTTAAQRLGWGNPTRASNFADGLPPDWHPYGPEVGHAVSTAQPPTSAATRRAVRLLGTASPPRPRLRSVPFHRSRRTGATPTTRSGIPEGFSA